MAVESLRTGELTVGAYLERVASAEAVPGGGSVSAVAAALGAGLLEMVARLSLDRPRYAPYEATIRRILPIAEQARGRLLELADEDAAAFSRYMVARRAAKDGSADQGTVREAARAAAAVPLEIVRLAAEVAAGAEALAGRSNLNASSDLSVAGMLAQAAVRSAAANVLINLPAVEDERFRGGATAEVDGYLLAVEHLSRRAQEVLGRNELRGPEHA